MGKIEKILAADESTSQAPVIELNDGGPDSAGIIHIQTERLRIELTVDEYRELAAAILAGGLTLSWNKNRA